MNYLVMKHYELLCILPGTLTEEEVSPVLQKVKEIITSQGGSEIETEDQGKNRLTYPMKHIRYGYFHLVRFQSEPESIIAMQKKFGMIDELLRALVHVYDPEKKKRHTEDLERLQQKKAQEIKRSEQKEITMAEEKQMPSVAPQPIKEKTEKPKQEKVDMDEINKKLDELIGGDLDAV